MMDFLAQIPPPVLLIMALFCTWTATTLGAAVIFCFKTINQKVLDIMLGISAGIMIAAAFWSLTIPAIDLAHELWSNNWLLPSLGFVTGGFFIVLTSLFLDKKLPNADVTKSNILLVSTITLHNIPEGLAVGVGFSSFAIGLPGCSLLSALMIATGIGIQNFPDGLAIAVPLYRNGMQRSRAFWLGHVSGLVEPISAFIGYFITIAIRSILPFLLTFAAGAMFTVVISELIPDIGKENRNASTLGFISSFVLIMALNLIFAW